MKRIVKAMTVVLSLCLGVASLAAGEHFFLGYKPCFNERGYAIITDMEIIAEIIGAIVGVFVEGVVDKNGKQCIPKWVRISVFSLIALGLCALMVLIMITSLQNDSKYKIVACIICAIVICLMALCELLFIRKVLRGK